MTASAAATGMAGDLSIADPAPLAANPRGWTWWAGAAISIAVLVAALLQIGQIDLCQVRSLVPTNPLFWLAFATAYLMQPGIDWVIFRRLWHVPAAAFVALTRKLIGNELLLGYIGELYFYTWARRRSDMPTAPFGAIKDAAILSALVGNFVSLAMVAVAYPYLGELRLGIDDRTLIGSIAVVLVSSSLLLFFRKKLFSLPGRELWIISGLQLFRVVANTFLTALCWHLVLPGVDYTWWLLLSAFRLLLSRLPLMPNKDIVFAGLAVFLIGHDAQIGALMALMASLFLATHVGLGLALVGVEAATGGRD